jgi:hypothetical protein
MVVFMLFAMSLPRRSSTRYARIELRCKAPPRYSWPSANPRASPQTSLA